MRVFSGTTRTGPQHFTSFAKMRKRATARGVLLARCWRRVMREQEWDWLRLAKGRAHFGHFQSVDRDMACSKF